MNDSYKKYFSIDSDHFHAVMNADLIKQNKDLWKKFYPHETFQTLLKQVIKALERKLDKSIRVEGAYGTGKSHAVLTVQKIIEADILELENYFAEYTFLDAKLLEQLKAIKQRNKNILTCYKCSSSNIKTDVDLFYGIQQGIEAVLKEKKFKTPTKSLKKSILNWLEDEANSRYFNSIKTPNFGDLTAEDIVQSLKNDANDCADLIAKISRLAEERNLLAMRLDDETIVKWIKEAIEINSINSFIFIWDEFSEFFKNNQNRLTGLQKLLEISSTHGFYLMLVTHDLGTYNSDDYRKLFDRFEKPVKIELPDNIAFKLLASAMKINKSNEDEWLEIKNDLSDNTKQSREAINRYLKLDNLDSIKNVLPLQPYTSLLLKYISEKFKSNQRSIFEFISDTQDGAEGFLWFIENRSPFENGKNLFSADMLWNYFYADGLQKNTLSILSYFDKEVNRLDSEDEKRVLKVILLLEAMSDSISNFEAFYATENNLKLIFEGDDTLGNSGFIKAIRALIQKEIIFEKDIGKNLKVYAPLSNHQNISEIKNEEEKVRKSLNLAQIIQDANFKDLLFDLDSAYKERYEICIATKNDLQRIVRSKVSNENQHSIIVAIAKDRDEADWLDKTIEEFEDLSENIIIVNVAHTYFPEDMLNDFISNSANEKFYTNKDTAKARKYQKDKENILNEWCLKIKNNEAFVYTATEKRFRCRDFNEVKDYAQEFIKYKYPAGLETINQICSQTLWKNNQVDPSSVRYGLKKEKSGQFNRIDQFLSVIWSVDAFEEKHPEHSISKAKKCINKYINERLQNAEAGNISVAEICDILFDAPYGYMPNKLTSYVIGFILSDCLDKGFLYSDGKVTEPLNEENLSQAVSNYLKSKIHNTHYTQAFIKTTSDEIKAYLKYTSQVFGVKNCLSTEGMREELRRQQASKQLPIVLAKYALKGKESTSNELVELYTNILNSNENSDEISAVRIGEIFTKNNNIIEEFKKNIDDDNLRLGLQNFVQAFNNGQLLVLAQNIEDNYQWINLVIAKYNETYDAKWVWKEEGLERILKNIIRQYCFIQESNAILSNKSNAYDATLVEWKNYLNRIKIPLELIPKDLQNLTPFFKNILEKGDVLQISEFTNILQSSKEGLNDFIKNQLVAFKKAIEPVINEYELSEKTINEIFKRIPSNVVSQDKQAFLDIVKNVINVYRSQSLEAEIKNLWKEKTGTKGPEEWSLHYQTPIFIMIDDEEIENAKSLFDLLQERLNLDEKELGTLKTFIETADFFEILNNTNAQNKAFNKIILKEYSGFLGVDEIREYLLKNLDSNPYKWMDLNARDGLIKKFAERKYKNEGAQKVNEVIDGLKTTEVKEYLKKLVANNMLVGLEIIMSEK